MTKELDGLQDALKAILEIAEKGDWERIVEINPEILAAQTSDRSPKTLKALIETQKLLQHAIALCQQRIEDISPLVEALSAKAAKKP